MKNDKKKNNWFKRRRYGYGWVPVTWQGWLVLVAFIAVVVGGAWLLEDEPQEGSSVEVVMFLALVLAAVAVLFIVTSIKGPKPRWRWGGSDKDNPEEDF